MSIVALKRKASSKYSRISSSRYSEGGFSLNNPRRVESKSGKEQYQTPMKGTSYRGHGSKLGHYPISVVKSQYTNSDNFVRDYSSDKSNQGISVKNNHASISTRNKWMKRGYPNYWVQPMEPKDYATYLREKKEQVSKSALGLTASDTSCTSTNTRMDGGTGPENPACNSNNMNMDGTSITKRVDTMDQSEYIQTRLMVRECLPNKGKNAHYPPAVSRNSTFVTVPDFTYEEFLEQQAKTIEKDNAC